MLSGVHVHHMMSKRMEHFTKATLACMYVRTRVSAPACKVEHPLFLSMHSKLGGVFCRMAMSQGGKPMICMTSLVVGE
jgi:hypothetical protein